MSNNSVNKELKKEILELKKTVHSANLQLVRHNLVIFTWGNVSGIDSSRRYMVIKPSGVKYENMAGEDMVVVDISTGEPVNDPAIGATSALKPSSDAPTHLELYKRYEDIGGIVHTHSTHATAYAQAGMPIVPLGTTHADYFHGSVPCTRILTENEVSTEYEKNTGSVIIETFDKLDFETINELPGVLVNGHGPFSWGKDPAEAVHNAVVLENIAEMNMLSFGLNPSCRNLPDYVLEKHYSRKHGKNAYYGQ